MSARVHCESHGSVAGYGIRSSVLADYSHVASACGLNPLRMLLDCRLPANSLTEPDLMLSVDKVSLLLERSAEQSRNIFFGLDLAEHRRLSHLGELGLLLRDLPTAREIHAALSSFVRFHNEALVYSLEVEGSNATVLIEPRTNNRAPSRQFTEFVLGAAYRIVQAQFVHDHQNLRVCFRHGAPAAASRHRRFFGHLPQFNQGFNGFVAPMDLLDKRNMMADPAFSLYTRNLVREKLGAIKVARSEEVRRLILQLLPSRRCDTEHIASCLGVDRRTVSRQLQREGTSVSALVNEIRHELIERYIQDSDLPFSEVARLLGFHSASALSNWYRRQFGGTLSKRRRRQEYPRPERIDRRGAQATRQIRP